MDVPKNVANSVAEGFIKPHFVYRVPDGSSCHSITLCLE